MIDYCFSGVERLIAIYFCSSVDGCCDHPWGFGAFITLTFLCVGVAVYLACYFEAAFVCGYHFFSSSVYLSIKLSKWLLSNFSLEKEEDSTANK